MTMHTILFKENEGIFPDPINGSQSEVPLVSVVGSQPPPPTALAAYNNHYLQSKLPSLELSAGRNLQSAVAKESDQDQQVLAKKDTNQFPIFPGNCRSGEKGAKSSSYHTVSSLQPASIEQFKLGVSQPLICGQYHYNTEQWYGIYSAYGAQIEGQRMMLPLSMGSNGGPIFVNAKQYNGIMRRRRSRAKAESKNQEMKMRKPYMHLSRHLHAVRRQRGSGGRFLGAKSWNAMSEKKGDKLQENEWTESQVSGVFESDGDGGIHSTKTVSSSSTGSEVTSYLHHFEFDRLHPSFLDVGNNYLKV